MAGLWIVDKYRMAKSPIPWKHPGMGRIRAIDVLDWKIYDCHPHKGSAVMQTAQLKDSMHTGNFLTILVVDGVPCSEQQKEEYTQGRPSRVRLKELHWPLQINAWQVPDREAQIVWKFMAWKDTTTPWMHKHFYWQQKWKAGMEEREVLRTPPEYDPQFPFRLVRGMNSDWDDCTECSISSDEEDQEEEEGPTRMKTEIPPRFRWRDHPAVKETRRAYRAMRSTRANLVTLT